MTKIIALGLYINTSINQEAGLKVVFVISAKPLPYIYYYPCHVLPVSNHNFILKFHKLLFLN